MPADMTAQGHIGTVTALDGGRARVRFVRSPMCEHCGACLTAGSTEMELEVANALHAAVGDRVEITLSPRRLLQASMLAYIVPLAALLIGIWLGGMLSERAGILIGIAACTLAFYGLRLLDRRLQRTHAFEPRMARLMEQEEDMDDSGTDEG